MRGAYAGPGPGWPLDEAFKTAAPGPAPDAGVGPDAQEVGDSGHSVDARPADASMDAHVGEAGIRDAGASFDAEAGLDAGASGPADAGAPPRGISSGCQAVDGGAYGLLGLGLLAFVRRRRTPKAA